MNEAKTKLPTERGFTASAGSAKCGCRACNPNAWWMVVCDVCGNKRCPHATDHKHQCTNSNEPGQPGSVYGPNNKISDHTVANQKL